MALIIETGAIVENANSYATLAEARAYAALRGETLPTVDAELEILMIKAMDYVENNEFQGEKVDTDQSTEFPRTGVYIDGVLVPSDTIPKKIKLAQMQATIEAKSADLMPNSDGKVVIREKVEGAIETQYSDKDSGTVRPTFPKVDAHLSKLLRGGAESSFNLRTVRA